MSKNASKVKRQSPASAAVYWLSILLLVGVPLSFSTAVYSLYSLPKFALLITGAAALVPLLIWAAINRAGIDLGSLLVTKQVLLVSLYVVVISISTAFGVAPVALLFGSARTQKTRRDTYYHQRLSAVSRQSISTV